MRCKDMTPGELSKTLRHVASKIDEAHAPSRKAVLEALQIVIGSLVSQTSTPRVSEGQKKKCDGCGEMSEDVHRFQDEENLCYTCYSERMGEMGM